MSFYSRCVRSSSRLKTRVSSLALILASLFLSATPAYAQLDPSILRAPWDQRSHKPHWADTNDFITFIYGGHSKQTDKDLDLFYWPSYGRFRIDRHDDHPPITFGYNFLTLSISGQGTGPLPLNYFDLGLVAATDLGQIAPGWDLSITAGLGSANDNHWSNAQAIYGVAMLEATHPLNDNTDLRVGIDYHGNRALWPDVPLPYVQIEQRLSTELTYTIGWPQSSLLWKPSHPVTLELDYNFPVNFAAVARYDFTEHVGVFAQYKHEVSGFYLNDGYGAPDHTRLFYGIDQIGTGVRLTWNPWLNADLGVGYAFNQDLATGFDIRDTNSVVTPSDHLFFFITMKGTF